MKKKLLVLLFSLATLALASCGGGNDVATSGVAPVVAQATVWTPQSNGGCGQSMTYGFGGPVLTPVQANACSQAITQNTLTITQCVALGGVSAGGRCWLGNTNTSGPLLPLGTETVVPTIETCISSMTYGGGNYLLSTSSPLTIAGCAGVVQSVGYNAYHNLTNFMLSNAYTNTSSGCLSSFDYFYTALNGYEQNSCMNAMNSLSGGGEKQYGSSAELCALLGGKFVLNAVCLPSWSK